MFIHAYVKGVHSWSCAILFLKSHLGFTELSMKVCVSDIAESDAHPEMLFNYLMISAMAAAVEQIEKNGIKFSGGNLFFLCR